MTSRVRDLELERDVDLLTQLQAIADVTTFSNAADSPLVETEGGIDELPLVGEEPLDAVVVTTLLVGGQRDNQVAVRK